MGIAHLGDAAHLMLPAWEEVNLAMCDAADLALAITGGVDWKDAIKDYETKLLVREKSAAETAIEMLEKGVSENAAQVIMDFLNNKDDWLFCR